MSIGDIPGRELLSHEESGFPNHSEYMIGDLLLHHKGVDESFAVNCCNSCLNTLRKGKLPATSIANNLQIDRFAMASMSIYQTIINIIRVIIQHCFTLRFSLCDYLR